MTRPIDTDAAVVLQERLFDAVDPAAWDRFAAASGGSFLGSWTVVAAEGITRTVRVFELVAALGSTPTKVGQCALAIANGRSRFLDRLHLLPAHTQLWSTALRLVIDRCGAGRYAYGSFWNHEERCPAAAMTGVPACRVVHAPFGIDRVDFAAWRDFAAYRRGISENIRRDYKKAAAASPRLVTRRGLAFISTVEAEGRLQAAFFGVHFGDAVYYLGGGTRGGSQGYGSYLFLTLLERWFAQHPRGILYLGENIPNVDPCTYTNGNLLYRRKLRAEVIPGTAFTVTVG